MDSTSDALELHAVPARGWRSGLGHMLRWEGARWWHTRQWWIQMLLWDQCHQWLSQSQRTPG